MNKIKKGLGRGLSSLIGETKVESKTNKLLLSDIVPNRFQPRKNYHQPPLIIHDWWDGEHLILIRELYKK